MDTRCRLFKIWMKLVHAIILRQKPRGVLHSRRRTGSLSIVILRRLRKTPMGFCLRVIVNEFIYSNNRQDTRCRLFKIWMKLVHNNPEAEKLREVSRSRRRTDSLCLVNSTPTAQNFSGLLLQGYCKRVSSKS